MESADKGPKSPGAEPHGQCENDPPSEAVPCEPFNILVIGLCESPIVHMSAASSSGGGNGSGARAASIHVSVSRSFSREASVTVTQSLEETKREVFNNLSMTNEERTEVNNFIHAKLRGGENQFIMLRYICSR